MKQQLLLLLIEQMQHLVIKIIMFIIREYYDGYCIIVCLVHRRGNLMQRQLLHLYI